MSGNATQIPTRRITNAEHQQVLAEVCHELTQLGIPHIPTTWLSGKDSHGDIDIVISEDHWPQESDFVFPRGVGQESRTGFTHLAWPIPESDDFVQVDFIRTEYKCLQQTKTYLSHGTFGNTLGLVCRSIGMRYGMRGLYLIARHPTGEKCGNIEITNDPRECLELLQLPQDDIERILNGSFPSREDYYPVLTRVPFFNRETIHPDRMTAPNRGRDKKRPEITPCREWMLANTQEPTWELPNRDNQEEYLAHQLKWQEILLGARLPGLLEEARTLSETLRKCGKARTAKDIWFDQTAELAGIEKSALGGMIHQLARSQGKDVNAFVLDTSPEQAAELIHNGS